MSESESWQASTLLTGQPFLVASRLEAKTKHGAAFLNVQLKARGGREITGRIWDRHRDLFERFQPGRVLDISGKLEEYQGRLSLIIEGAETSTIPVAEFMRQTHLDTDETWRKLQTFVNGMNEPLTRFVSQRLMARSGFEAAFKRAPAASKMHNNWGGGLIEHVYSLCQLAEFVVSHYRRMYDAPVSRDKVLFGIIFHDAGKIQEYDIDSPAYATSTIGKFVPHIVLGPAWVYEAAKHFKDGADPIELAHLMHILAAHHGTEEWGSPVKPASLEAVIVHHLDNLDAKVLHALEYVLGASGDIPHFSERSWAERTPFFQAPSSPSAPPS
jgi:3'-5' exoribonuclease